MMTNRRIFLVWLSLLALALTYWVIVTHVALIIEIAWVLLGAMLLSLAIRPLADKGQTWRIPRGVTTIAIYIVLVAVVILVGSLVTPIVRTEITQVQQTGPQLWQQVQQRLAATPLSQWLPSTDSMVQSIGQRLDTLAVSALGTVTSIGSLLLDFLLLFILAFFFVTDSGWGGRLLFNWIPANQQPRARKFIANTSHQLTRWVWAQLGLAIYFGVAFTLVLTILQVPFALTIGLVGGVLEFIPYLGGLVALTLGLFTALTVSPTTALWLILLYTAVTLLEGHVIAPFFYGRAIGLRSAVVLVALFIGAKAAGVLGVFFAVPVTVILTAVVQEGRTFLLPTEAGT
jgi:predicted PurR-regulated permease PerM